MALTRRHVLLEDLGRTAWSLLHGKRLPQICLLMAASQHHVGLLASTTLILVLMVIGVHVSELCLHEHIVLDVLVLVEDLLTSTQT